MHLIPDIKYSLQFIDPGKTKKVLGDEGCRWRTLEKIVRFASVLGAALFPLISSPSSSQSLLSLVLSLAGRLAI